MVRNLLQKLVKIVELYFLWQLHYNIRELIQKFAVRTYNTNIHFHESTNKAAITCMEIKPT